MNRPVCKSCYFFNKHGAYCNRLEITNEKRNGRPTNTTCIDKMTKADAEKAQEVSDMIWNIKRHHI